MVTMPILFPAILFFSVVSLTWSLCRYYIKLFYIFYVVRWHGHYGITIYSYFIFSVVR